MNAKYLLLCWMVFGTAMASAAPPRVPATFDPNDPEKTRTIISREEREKLGLTPRTWTGVVQPEVYPTLDRLNRTAAGLKDRLAKKKGRDVEAFDALRRIRYEGMVYVQVQLKHDPMVKADSVEDKAAIKQLQSKVLSQLTAAEFFVEYPFQTLPGILGYVNREGLEKLKASADVIAVCLDDKPFPDRPPSVTKEDLPPLTPGDPSTQPAEGRFWGSGGKAAAEVYQALATNERVFVIVLLKDPRAHKGPSEENIGKGRAVEDRVLASMSADEFWLPGTSAIGSALGPILDGFVNIDGLKKLENHAEVDGVGLDLLGRIPERRSEDGKRWTP